ncbi:MAG: Ig-like domain-containing protein [Thermoanaerobaculia bacterium]
MRTKTLSTMLAATAFSIASLSFGSGALLAATNQPSDPIRNHEECTPLHNVSVLRNHVKWSARENAPVALAAEFTSETVDGAADFVAWRLVLTTMDRTVVDTRHGSARLDDGRTIVAETFDGRDSAGHPLASGLYVYRFEAESYEGSGGFLRVYGSDETPDPPVEDTREPLATSSNPSVPYSFFFGSQHAHTIYSDGGTAVSTCTGSISSPHAGATPTDAFAYAKASGGVDWICVIEHNHLIDDACGTGCSTATVRGRYQDGLNAAIASTTANFVGIYGMEYGVIGNPVDHEGHVAFYDITKLFSWEAYADVITSKTDYLSLWTSANNAANQGPSGAAGGFCHPKTSDYASWAQNAAGLNVIRGVAVISGPAFEKTTTFSDGGSRFAGPSAGTDMYQYALQRGWTVGPEAHQDNHCWNYGNATRNRTVVLANSLSKASVMGAIRARRFYATSDKNAQMFFGTSDYAHTMGEIFTTSVSSLPIRVWVSDPDGATISTVTLYTGNPAAGSGSPTSSTMTNAGGGSYTANVTVPATGQAYYYTYVTLSNGAELWSAPIWVSKSGACSDTTLPTAAITAPTATTVTGTVAISATGTDNIGVTAMTLKVDGATVATSTSGSVGFSWNTSALVAGSSHTITVTSEDACGNVSATASKTVTIGSSCTDVTAPTAAITAPTATSVSGTVAITATGTDNIAVTAMTLKVDGTTVATSATGSVSSSWNTTGLAAGSSHTITATSSDACGNVSATATKTVTIATTSVFTDPTGNPGFEAATVAPWVETGTYEQISTVGAAIDGVNVTPRGTKMAWMAGYDNATDTLKQNLTIPNATGSVNLGYWRQVHTTDGTATAYDNLFVEIWNSAGTSKLATLQTLTNKNAGSTWIHNTGLLLDTWKGQTIQVRFTATNDTSNPTDFFIDDVTITNP